MQLKLIIVKTTMTIEKGNREKSQRVSEIERWFAKEVGEKEKDMVKRKKDKQVGDDGDVGKVVHIEDLERIVKRYIKDDVRVDDVRVDDVRVDDVRVDERGLDDVVRVGHLVRSTKNLSLCFLLFLLTF